MKIFTKHINYHKIILIVFLLISAFTQAQLKKAFAPRFNEAVNGDFTIIANNMISTTATGNYNGGNDNDQFSNLVYVDIDTDDTTFNSSSANFVNPAPTTSCLTIKKVLLYWAAADQEPNELDPNSENQPDWNYNDIKLMLPSETAYTTYTADEVIYRGREDHIGAPHNGHFSNDPYICVKDITSSVVNLIDNSISPYGSYQVANVEGKIGSLNDHNNNLPTGVSGGWQIVFVYESPLLPLKNISIFDGYGHVVNGQGSYNIDFNGFQTVPTGDVNANILIGALEGDLGLDGDRLQIENVSNTFVDLSTSPTSPIRDTNNFFNSKITIDNANFTDRIPASTNTLGFDAAIFQLSNPDNTIINNNQTSATFRLASNKETYGLFLLGLSIDVWSPNLGPIHLTLDTPTTSLNPSASFGASFTVENKGNDDAKSLEISTTLPPQVTLIEPISPALPTGITYNYNTGTNLLEFFVADGVANAGAAAVNVDFDLEIRDECYFLETSCDLQFNLQLEASYTGTQDPSPQSVVSSANLDDCGVGILDPIVIDVIQPTISWQTPINGLDTTIECSDVAGLTTAQALEPVTNKCNLTLTKTPGAFVPNPTCPSSGTYTNTWNFTDACGVTIGDYVQVITIVDTMDPLVSGTILESTVEGCSAADATAPVSTVAALEALGLTIEDCTDDANLQVTSSDSATGTCPVIVTRTYTITDACGNSTTASQIINVTPVAISFTNPTDNNVQSCDFVDQTEVNTAFDNWVIAQSAAIAPVNGCTPVLSNNSSLVTAPVLCDGGTTTVTWTITDLCETINITADFNLTAPTAISFTNPVDNNVQSCDFVDQNEVNTAFDNWVIAQSAAIAPVNGCTPVLSNNSNLVTAPVLCDGGTTTVTWTITDLCQIINITADFNLTVPTAISFTNPADSNVQSCDFDDQNEVNTAFDNWVIAQSAAISPTNGCTPVLSNNSNLVSAPLLCDGGTATVTWTITDLCQTINTITADFNLTAPTDISFTNPANDSSIAAEFDDPDSTVAQANLDADIAAWVAAQTAIIDGSITNGCDPVVTSDFTNQSITFCNSGSITITWTITDLCQTINVSANYTFTQPDGISFTNPSGNTANSCDFDNDDPAVAQANLDADIAAWVTAQTAVITGSLSGGSPAVSNDFTNQSIDLCTGGSLTVTWTIDDICETITPTATYSLTTPTVVTYTNPADNNVQSCDFADQTEVNTAFDNWVIAQSAAITISNGCSPVLSNNSASVSAPLLCDGGTTTVTWTITDLCQTINITADFNLTAPTVISLTNPADNNVQSCDFVDQNEVNTAFDNWVIAQSAAIAPVNGCTPVLSNNSNLVTAPVLCDGGTTTVTWTITDLCQTINITADFNLTVPTAISFTNPADSNVQSCDFDDQNEVNTAFDNWVIAQSAAISPTNGCTPVLSNNSNLVSAPLLCDGGTATVTWTITDLCQTINTITADFNLTAPTDISFTNPANDSSIAAEFDDPDSTVAQANLDADIAAWVAAQTAIIDGSITNGCDPVVTSDFTNQSITFCNSGSITITWTITDLCQTINVSANYTFTQPDGISFTNPSGNTANSCDFDNDDPAVAQANLDADIAAWVTAQTAVITGSLSGGSPTVSNDFTNQSIDLCTGGSITVTWTIDDICETLTPTATYNLTTPTAITYTNPSDDSSDACEFGTTDLVVSQANLDSDIAAWVSGQTAAINSSILGGCSPIVTSNFLNQSIDFCTGGAITITWTIEDLCETTTQTATYTFTPPTSAVFDQTTLPADLTVECDLLTPAEILTATNSCGNINVVFTEVRTDGDCPNRYSLLRTWTATNICGIATTHTQTVTVTDNTPPVLTLPANQTAECSDDLSPIAFGSATATDNCDANPSITSIDVTAEGSCPGTFKIIRTWTAEDACGNKISADQEISVSDTTAPEFVQTTLPGNIAIECISDIPVPEDLDATDNCGDASVDVVDERIDGSSDNNFTIRRSYIAIDECGRTNTHVQTIIVEDKTPPVFEQATLPLPSITVECDAIPNPEELKATDNCGGDVSINVVDETSIGLCPNNYTITRTWTATDESGLKTTYTQVITVQDTKAPVPESTFEEVLNVSCTDIPDAPELTFTDNCSTNITVAFNETNSYEENVFADYEIVRTWIVRDECNNEETYTQTLQVALDEIITDLSAPDWCYDEGAINMNNLLPSDLNTNGTWELLEGDPVATLNGSIFDPSNLELSADFLPESGGIDYRFRYTTTDNGCISITEVIMNVHADCVVLPCGENDITISKAVTPNGDDRNDFFYISGIELCGFTAEVKIFNRWGALVFESNAYPLIKGVDRYNKPPSGSWEGTAHKSSIGNAGKVPNGTYYYIITLKDSGLNPITGPVYLGTK
ncbi:gliding motility-associated C-terminal domain-containing protein [Flavivirga rizhaonensis]|uniref:Gliding motility-associated C-terminal domain-containing protein n=1 Tax=Flavivirga rizhaonensis TaxID=2559571 RepID=A0A4S1DT17_9FLAO|nr:gliding motility-associated C-terminal domain-containing protein [Flavivirga rizhaonensis]